MGTLEDKLIEIVKAMDEEKRLGDKRAEQFYNLIGEFGEHELVGDKHTASGLTVGHFLKATGATSFAFVAHGLTYSDVGAAASGHNHNLADLTEKSHASLTDVSADQHHAQIHAPSHKSGGSDAIKLDEFATPDDNTNLDASASRHGLLKKLSGATNQFLDGGGNWQSLAGLTKIITLTPPTDITAGLTWDNVLRDLDLTSQTSSAARWVILSVYMRRASDFLTPMEFFQYSDSAQLVKIASSLVSGTGFTYAIGQGGIWIPVDSEQRIKYKAPASAAADKFVQILGYVEIV